MSGNTDNAHKPIVPGAFTPGDVIAKRYKVLRILGKGGMGVVYLVDDRKTNTTIALKTLKPVFARNKRAVGRFVREVNAVRRLNHPGIVRIFESRQYGDLLYYTMEHLNGRTLRYYMRKRGPLGMGRAIRIMSLLCKAIEHVHEVTIHRDLSPENVMLLPNGTLKLLDFGLAKLDDPGGPQFTMIGSSLGKMHYNAPEQRANAASVDKRADIYSLGIMFFEMLSGMVPRDYQPITGIMPELSQEFDDFFQKALAEAPENRFSSAEELRQALGSLYQIHLGKLAPKLAEEAVPSEKATAFARLTGWVSRIIRRLRPGKTGSGEQ